MATKIPDGVSIRVVVDVTDSICAALESDPDTSALTATWASMRDKADGLAKARLDCDRAATRARPQLAVRDAKWDATVAAFGRAVVDASGGRRDQPPYTRFFDKTTPSAAQKFGIEREIEAARAWLVELGRNPSEPLAQTWTPTMKGATDGLEMAFNQRNDTVKALGPLQTSVVLLIDDVTGFQALFEAARWLVAELQPVPGATRAKGAAAGIRAVAVRGCRPEVRDETDGGCVEKAAAPVHAAGGGWEVGAIVVRGWV